MKRTLKFLHTMGAVGLMGSMASLLVLLSIAPPPSSLAGYAQARAAMNAVTQWVFIPSLGATLVAGLLAVGLNRAFHNAGWAWVKLATGILMFEGGLVDVQGPIQEEAERSGAALLGKVDPATLAGASGPEWNLIWILLGVSTANVVLGIWRPRLTRRPAQEPVPVPEVEGEA